MTEPEQPMEPAPRTFSLHERRLIIVIRASVLAAAEAAVAEYIEGPGPYFSTQPLKTPAGTNPVAYWLSGVFTVDVPMRVAKKLNRAVVQPGETPSKTSNYLIFDANDNKWTPQQVLTYLNLEPVSAT